MSVDEKFDAEIDAAIKESLTDDTNQQAKSTDPGQSDTSGKERDTGDSKLETKDDSLETSGDETEGEATPADETKESTQQKAEPVAISDAEVARAIRAGFTMEDIRTFPSEDSLSRVVTEVLAVKNAVKQDTQKETQKEETKPVDPFVDFPTLDPEAYEPEVIKAFETLKNIVKGQSEAIEQFKTQQQETRQVSEAAAAKEAEQWFDKQVEGLGQDFTDALGTGGYSSLATGSVQLAKRDAIASQVAVMLAGYRQTGQTTPPREEVFDAAARLVLRDEYQRISEQNLTKDLTKRSKQHIQRAGSQSAKTKLSPDEEIAAEINEKFYS
jgi:hypothetical protein